MNTPKVSVVMAAKDYARFLPAAVESVRAQTFADWELVIVDDGSKDGTAAAARPYLADARVRLIESDRLGQPRAKNLGARLARGEYLAYLDADDAWLPTKLAKQVARLDADPGTGVCFCLRTLVDEAGHPLPTASSPPLPPRGQVLPAIFARNFVCFSSVLVRRDLFERVGGFDPEFDLAIDYDLWLRAARHCAFDCVDEELVLYRTGHGNLSKKLADRVLTADSIMTRAVYRRGLGEALPRGLVAEGYASTYRALAYTLRRSEPLSAARWYGRALAAGGRRWEAARGLVASLAAMPRPRTLATGENAGENR